MHLFSMRRLYLASCYVTRYVSLASRLQPMPIIPVFDIVIPLSLRLRLFIYFHMVSTSDSLYHGP